MVEKEAQKTFDEKLIEQLDHRTSLLSTTDKKLSSKYNTQEKALIEQQRIFQQELKILEKEIEFLQETAKTLRKTVFVLGHQLKNKVTTQMSKSIQDKIESWPLEEYITKKELPKLFEKYTKQKLQTKRNVKKDFKP